MWRQIGLQHALLLRPVILLILLVCDWSYTKVDTAALGSKFKEDDTHYYSFEQYMIDYKKNYHTTDEYTYRKRVFERNLQYIVQHNNHNNHHFVLGINHLMDLESSELPLGYDKSMHQAWKYQQQQQQEKTKTNDHYPVVTSVMEKQEQRQQQQQQSATTSLLPLSGSSSSVPSRFVRRLNHPSATTPLLDSTPTADVVFPFTLEDPSNLPKTVDWRTEGIITPVKNQGGCGSCWAFASIAALESHIARKTGTLFSLSPQELVSCSFNPNHCGGSGACTGSTAEIAFDFVSKYGIVDEWKFGYQSFDGKHVNCSLIESTVLQQEKESEAKTTKRELSLRSSHNSRIDNDHDIVLSSSSSSTTTNTTRTTNTAASNTTTTTTIAKTSTTIKGAVATIDGYFNIPSNNYTVMMNAIAKYGPLVVCVAANHWGLYKGGVFHHEDHSSPDATDINHAVVLVGYGTDQQTGKDYWLVRNSWGPKWGEDGYIRLQRTDPSTLIHPEDDCGMDVRPADGIACTEDNGHKIVPSPVRVCGTSGILFDGVIPLGGRLV